MRLLGLSALLVLCSGLSPAWAQPPSAGALTIATGGQHPQVMVDDLGTAHIVWNEPREDGHLLRYCQIERATPGSCTRPAVLLPPEPNGSGNVDSIGPRIVEVLPEQIQLLTHRYPNVVSVRRDSGHYESDCTSEECFGSDTKIWSFSSFDNGLSWRPADVLSHEQTPSGDAIAFGPDAARLIATISDTVTGGTYFQAVDPQGWTNATANLAGDDPNRAYDGTVAVTADQRPIVAFVGLDGVVYTRRYSAGEFNDPSSWDAPVAVGRGDQTRLAHGPLGVFLFHRVESDTHFRWAVRRLEGGAFGSPEVLSPEGVRVSEGVAFEDDGGHAHTAWVEDVPRKNSLRYRSFDGTNWAAAFNLHTDELIEQVDIGAAEDGGGRAVWRAGDGSIRTQTFGPQNVLYDVRLRAIEVNQGIQNHELAGQDRERVGEPVPYRGVRLVAGKPTAVRVYVNSRTEIPEFISRPLVQLQGIRDGRVIDTLTPERNAADLLPGPLEPPTPLERREARDAYTFTLPWNWIFDGEITLRATVNAPGTTPRIAECSSCVANNTLSVTGVKFEKTRDLFVIPYPIRVNGTMPAAWPNPHGPFRYVEQLSPPRLQLDWFGGIVDVSDVINAGSFVKGESCFIGIWPCTDVRTSGEETEKYRRFYVRERVRQQGRDEGHVGPERFVFGIAAANTGVGGTTNAEGLYGKEQPVATATENRPLTSIGHEFEHGIGRLHAGLKCGSNDDGQVGEPWPPEDWGYLDGFGLDLTQPSPYYVVDPFDSDVDENADTPELEVRHYDLMSYCAAGEANAWMSVRNWDRAFGAGSAPPRVARSAQSRTLPAGVTAPSNVVEVSTIVADGGTSQALVHPVAATPTRVQPGDAAQLAAMDANGKPLRTAGVLAEPLHIDETTGIVTQLTGRIDVSGAAGVAVVQGDTYSGARIRSANRPTVRVPRPRGNTVTWTARDADGDGLSALVEYSSNGGRSWKPVFRGVSTGKAVIPRVLLAPARRGRVRVLVSDGFDAARAQSPFFRVRSSGPVALITNPRRSLRVQAGARVVLEGTAIAPGPRTLPAGALHWFDGRRRIGRGRRITTPPLGAGRHPIRLEARAGGKRGRATVRVKVGAAPVHFTRISAPRRMSAKARAVTLRVATSVPGTLRVGRRRYPVGTRARRVVVPVSPGRAPLRLTLRVGSGRFAAVARVRIARR